MQIEGYSRDAQKECLRKEAKHRNMIIVDEYSDEGKSGKNMCQWGGFSLTHFLIEDESYVTDFNGI
ncbi:MAG: hypothetical protein IIV92_06540 [Schwartzia sp.]|nr:hypothetical protein [Schwartzia sp. (in: firmicutes)]